MENIKSLLREAHNHTLPEQLESEKQSFVDCLHHRDALEGITAFLEKRKPRYQ
jgi:enoyl-CoA hydratase/carnithine racemase